MSEALEKQFGIIDFINDAGHGVDLLPDFLKYSPNFLAIYKAVLKQVQELHDAQKEVYSKINIFEAVGSQLDTKFGNWVNIERLANESDNDYRNRILAQWVVLSQSGQITVMKNLFRSLVSASDVDLFEQEQASFSMVAVTDLVFSDERLTKVMETLFSAKQGGNTLTLGILEQQANGFKLSGETDSVNGFGNGILVKGF